VSIPIVKRFLGDNFSVKNGPQNGAIWGNGGLDIRFMFATPKRHILGRNRMFWRISRQYPSTALGCSELQEPNKKTNTFWCAKSSMRGNETFRDELLHRCRGLRRNHVCRFVLRSLTGFGRGGGQILGFSIDLLRRPYNTLALFLIFILFMIFLRNNTPTVTTTHQVTTPFERTPYSIQSHLINSGLIKWIKAVITVG